MLFVAVAAAAVTGLVVSNILREGDPAGTEQSVYDDGSVLYVLDTDGRFDTLLDLIERNPVALEYIREGDPTLTVFAPTDDAFTALGEAQLESILDSGRLTWLIQSHVVKQGDGLLTADLTTGAYLNAGSGNHTEVVVTDDGITYGGADLIEADIETTDGVIHVLDGVVLPWES